MTVVEMRSVSIYLSSHFSLRAVSAEVRSGEVLGLIGPSGSGKSTILKLMTGLAVPDSGAVLIEGRVATPELAAKRGVVLVWQSLALFPHLRVGENVGFGLRVRSVDHATRRAKVATALELVGLGGFEGRGLQGLSGGERQRVALARALAIDPAVILLDEPFGSVDQHLRSQVVSRLNDIRRETKATMVLVTHDQTEAFCVADRVGVLNEGRIEQIGTAKELQDRPATGFVAEFIGRKVVIRGRFRRKLEGNRLGEVEVGGRIVLARLGESKIRAGESCALVAEPESVSIAAVAEGPDTDSTLKASSVGKVPLGGLEAMELRLPDGARVNVPLMKEEAAYDLGTTVWLSWDIDCCRIVPC